MKQKSKTEVKLWNKLFLKKILLYTTTLLLCYFATPIFAAEITSVNVNIQNNEIYVTASVNPDSKFIDDLNNGLSKELIFYIDLFRIWNIWPDEFVIGRKIQRILKSNLIKREYVAISIDGNIEIEKKFKDIKSMVGWGMSIINIKLINIKELEPGDYFVKVTVDSKIRRLPPVIGYFLFFVPENEFSISKNSLPLQIK